MKIEDAWEGYYAHTGKASDVSRQLALGGLAIIWLFYKDDSAANLKIDPVLGLPTFLFVLALGFDLLQYLALSLVWGFWIKIKEKQLLKSPQSDPDIEAPKHINKPGEVLFLVKILLVCVAYYELLKVLACRWF